MVACWTTRAIVSRAKPLQTTFAAIPRTDWRHHGLILSAERTYRVNYVVQVSILLLRSRQNLSHSHQAKLRLSLFCIILCSILAPCFLDLDRGSNQLICIGAVCRVVVNPIFKRQAGLIVSFRDLTIGLKRGLDTLNALIFFENVFVIADIGNWIKVVWLILGSKLYH